MDGELVPFTAATTRPDEPITAGVDIGDGVGSEALLPVSDGRLNLIRALENDGSADAMFLRDMAMRRGWI